jgi:hypothetical protein
MSGPSIKPLPVDPAVLARIRPMMATDVPAVARLHHAAMGASVWARLGRRFLEAVYAALLTHRDFRGYVYHEEGRVRGFIAGSCNGPRMFRQIAFQHAPTLALATLAGVARNPRVLWQLAQSARYFAQSGVSGVDGIVAESLFCSFEPDLRGRRVSGLINKVLFDELAALGHRFVKITTDADNALSARQLTSWGFSRMGTFRFYGKEMLAWRLDLTTSPRVSPVHRFGTAGLTGGQR